MWFHAPESGRGPPSGGCAGGRSFEALGHPERGLAVGATGLVG